MGRSIKEINKGVKMIPELILYQLYPKWLLKKICNDGDKDKYQYIDVDEKLQEIDNKIKKLEIKLGDRNGKK